MQEELKKHSKKIFTALQNPHHTAAEKAKEIILEIFIIAFAVTLSIWLHSWSEHRHEQLETMDFLADLRDDLADDVENMAAQKRKNLSIAHQYRYLKTLSKEKIDSTLAAKGHLGIQMNLIIRKTNLGNYEGFKSSGKIGYIEDKKIKKLILKYYQESAPSLQEAENLFNSQMLRLMDQLAESKDIDKMFLDPSFKTKLDFILQSAETTISGYEETTKQLEELMHDLDLKLNR